VKDLQYVAK